MTQHITRTLPTICFALLALPVIAQDAPPPPAWRASVQPFVPQGFVAGEALPESDANTGRVAVYPAGGDDPKTPGSVFAPRQMLVVKLDGQRAVSGQLEPRTSRPAGNRDTTQTNPDENEDDFDKLHRELNENRASLPAGTEPCDLHAWSIDKDPKGLNVRSEASTKGRVLGTLPAPYTPKMKKGGSENAPIGGWLTEFKVVGYKDGWFLIEGAKPPGKDYEDDELYPKNAPKPYAGRGWVSAARVGASFANGGTRMGGLFQAPFSDAHWKPAQREGGGALDVDGGPKRVFACSGAWGLVESVDGVRGWWRSLCSNQVTNCS